MEINFCFVVTQPSTPSRTTQTMPTTNYFCVYFLDLQHGENLSLPESFSRQQEEGTTVQPTNNNFSYPDIVILKCVQFQDKTRCRDVKNNIGDRCRLGKRQVRSGISMRKKKKVKMNILTLQQTQRKFKLVFDRKWCW